MIRLLLVGLVFACAVSMTSCGTKSRQASGNSDTAAVAVSVADTATAVVPVYAKGYAVKHLPGNVRLVDIHDPQKEEGNTFRYALVPRGTKPVGIPDRNSCEACYLHDFPAIVQLYPVGCLRLCGGHYQYPPSFQ